MRQLLHVGFAFRDAPRPEELEPIFDEGDDCVRPLPG
jgi:hypothetical protein